MPDVPAYPGFLLFVCVCMVVYGCHLISQDYWARQRARGPAYWQAMLDAEFRGGPQNLCEICVDDDHAFCWTFLPEDNCPCCEQTLTKDGGWAAGPRRYGEVN